MPLLALSPWSFAIEPAVTGVVTWIVQSFCEPAAPRWTSAHARHSHALTHAVRADAYRVFVISRRKYWLSVPIGVCSLVQLGFSIGATAKIFMFNRQFSQFHLWTYGVAIWLGSAAFAGERSTT